MAQVDGGMGFFECWKLVRTVPYLNWWCIPGQDLWLTSSLAQCCAAIESTYYSSTLLVVAWPLPHFWHSDSVVVVEKDCYQSNGSCRASPSHLAARIPAHQVPEGYRLHLRTFP
jgi:hypothetical protein